MQATPQLPHRHGQQVSTINGNNLILPTHQRSSYQLGTRLTTTTPTPIDPIDTLHHQFSNTQLNDQISPIFAQWFEHAARSLEQDNPEEAERSALKAADIMPENLDVYLLLARISLRLGRLHQSSQYVFSVIRKRPPTRILLEAYVLVGHIARDGMQWKEAIDAYRRSLEIDPTYCDALIHLGGAYAHNFQFDEAIKTYLQVLEMYPNMYCVRSDLGNVYKYVGQLEDAKNCYIKAIETNPSFAIAWSNLGCIFNAQNEIWLAIHYFEKASQLDPHFLDAFLNLGNVLKLVGSHERAVTAYLNALNIAPNNPIVIANLAAVYYDRGQLHLAIDMYRRALEIKPAFPDALCNLANALKLKGDSDEAEKCYLRALELDPRHADSLNNLANLKRERGLVQQALKMYERAIEVCPQFAAPHANIANLMQHHKIGSPQAVVDHYREVIRLQPNSADAHLCMGNALKDLIGDTTTALTYYDRAIHLNPTSLEAYLQMASTLKDRGDIDGAISSYRVAIRIRPDFPDAVCSLAHCLQVICDWSNYSEMQNEVISIVRQQLANCGAAAQNRAPETPCSVHPHHSMLYPFSYTERKAIAAKHAELCVKRVYSVSRNPFTHRPEDRPQSVDGRIRIGYVSSDFCNHPTSHLMQSVPGMHNRSRFDIYCYALTPDDGTNFRSKIKREAEHFIDISQMTFFDAASLIYSHCIDILINLNGYTKGAQNEIFAMTPAPVQVMWLGYPNTSGSKFMQYIITDAVASPLEQADQFSEKMAYMPDSFFIGDHKQMFNHITDKLTISPPTTHPLIVQPASSTDNKFIINVPPGTMEKAALRKPEDTVANSRANDDGQITSAIATTCTALANSCSSSSSSSASVMPPSATVAIGSLVVTAHLGLLPHQHKEAAGELIPNNALLTCRSQYGLPENAIVFCNFNQLYKIDPKCMNAWCNILNAVPNSVIWLLRFPASGEGNLIKYAFGRGLNPNRLIFTNVAPKEEHVRRGQLADICLDTPLCNGHTTGMDILWAGTPMITFPLDSLASRVAASQLAALGCPELIANSFEQYEQIGIRLGNDHEELARIRQKVFDARLTSSLFNVQTYTRNLEKLYECMYSRFRNGMPLDHILSLDSSSSSKSA
ncbi:hypothetical protein ACOME3_006335 [Neoechinorhynchus agilis]